MQRDHHNHATSYKSTRQGYVAIHSLAEMAGGGNGRRRVSGDETKNEIGKSERCRRNKWTVKKILAWVWRWKNKKDQVTQAST
ncbi:hypothetical protein ACSQ67_021336 [Phaseolus vulgaris]